MIEESHEDRAADPQTVAAIKESFNGLLDQNKPDKSYVMGKDTYNSYLATLLQSPSAFHLNLKQRFSNRKRFKVLFNDNQPYLARANSNKRVYYREEIFDVIFAAHCSCNHGDGRRTYAIVKEFADNIFLWECLLVTKLCYCKRTKSRASKSRIASSPRTKAGDIHLMNMESIPDKQFRWILLYMDDTTKFLFARPLRTRDREEIAFELLHLFLNHGAPLFINTSLSKSFIMKLLQNLYSLWPGCPTVFGQQLLSDNHPEFLKNLERWMKESNTRSWAIGCAFVASALNAQESMTLGCTPYSLMHRTTLERCSATHYDFSSARMDSHDSEQDNSNEADSEGVSEDSDMMEAAIAEHTFWHEDQSAADVAENEASISTVAFFPFSESEDLNAVDLIAFFQTIKVIENLGRGECLFFVVRQHLKAFTFFEHRVETLRTKVADYLLSSAMGKEFLQKYHQDVDANSLAENVGNRSSWGGPETLLAISQLFNVHITLLSFIREGTVPYVSKYWPVSDVPPSTNTLQAPSANHMVVQFEDNHYTLLLPLDLEYLPKRFKRERQGNIRLRGDDVAKA